MPVGRINKSARSRGCAIRWRTSARAADLCRSWACTANPAYLAGCVILIGAAGHYQPGIHFNICIGRIAYRIWVQMVGRIVYDVFRLDIKLCGPLTERDASQPLPIYSIHRQDQGSGPVLDFQDHPAERYSWRQKLSLVEGQSYLRYWKPYRPFALYIG